MRELFCTHCGRAQRVLEGRWLLPCGRCGGVGFVSTREAAMSHRCARTDRLFAEAEWLTTLSSWDTRLLQTLGIQP